MAKNPTVSIVTPVYNSARFLDDTIATIQAQTFTEWEVIFVDDCSTDTGVDTIKKAQASDNRIKLIQNKVNSGAGASRNSGVEIARGRYLCFLDADDLWHPEKLQKQLNFVHETGAAFSCTGYEFADEQGEPSGKQVIPPATANYRQLLTNVTVWTSTTMFDLTKLTKADIRMPDIRRGQDAATWWQVLKKVDYAYGLPEVLAYYRRTSDTLSANKLKAVQRTWYLYRQVERISLLKSLYYIVCHSINATRRRL